MQKIKEYVQKYKVPLIIGTFLVLLGVAYFMGKHHATATNEEQQPVVIPQDLLDNTNALQNKLDISEQNAKLLQTALDKVQTGKTSPVANYYVTAPNVKRLQLLLKSKLNLTIQHCHQQPWKKRIEP